MFYSWDSSLKGISATGANRPVTVVSARRSLDEVIESIERSRGICFDQEFFIGTFCLYVYRVSYKLSQGTAESMISSLCRIWLFLFAVLLTGLLLANRSFAYLGAPPVFITEITLASGLSLAVLGGMWLCLFNSRVLLPLIPLLLFVGWGLYCTVPYVGNYGTAALRDAVLYGYSAFGLLVVGMYFLGFLTRDLVIEYYSRLWTWVPFLYPVVFGIVALAGPSLPKLPGTDVSLLTIKSGDVCVHLCGLLAFSFAGLRERQSYDALRFFLLVIMAIPALSVTRAGMLSIAMGVCIAILLSGVRSSYVLAIAIICGAFAVSYMADLEVHLYGRERNSLSARQVSEKALSIVGQSHDRSLTGTANWRKEWWKEIVGYTVYGPYRWAGKGFGINLAADDGFMVGNDESAHISPHCIHMSVLARMGVPGLIFWGMTLLAWFWQVVSAYWSARHFPDPVWKMLFTVVLAWFAAAVVNASFDMAIEGPMMGVWFWSVYGLGIVLAADFKLRQEQLADQVT
jgi:hypothetical protein